MLSRTLRRHGAKNRAAAAGLGKKASVQTNISGISNGTSPVVHLPRYVSPLGFQGDIHRMFSMDSRGARWTPLLEQAIARAEKGETILLTGCSGTGKFTLANHIVDRLSQGNGDEKRPRVAKISLNWNNTFRMQGLSLYSYVGLRFNRHEDLPSTDQMIAAFERHVRLMKDAYASIFPTLATTDILLFDSIHHATPDLLKAMDAVARTVRNQPDVPFGGIQVIATADFWKMKVHPNSPNHGYVFQDERFSTEWFPRANQFYLKKIFRHGDYNDFTYLTHSALYGSLKPADINRLVDMCRIQRVEGLEPTPMLDNSHSAIQLYPKFPRQPAKLDPPEFSASLRRFQFGHYYLSVLHNEFYGANLAMTDRLSIEVGSTVELCVGNSRLPRTSIGIVTGLSAHSVTVDFPERNVTETIPPIKVVAQHPDYEEIKLTYMSFPLIVRTVISPSRIIANAVGRHYILDARYLTDTNDLGNVLANTHGPRSVSIVPKSIEEFLKRDGIISDPVKIFYEELDGTLANYQERWCRNCKTYIPGKEFSAHWKECIESVRWCSDCNTTIPAAKWEPHCEKHTIVMCIDCGTPLEWRDWEQHRMTCTPMLRELTAENVMLPSSTRDSAMSSGHDRRDLQTVEKISRSRLPKSHLDVVGRRR